MTEAGKKGVDPIARPLSTARAAAVPLTFAAALVALAFLPPVGGESDLVRAFLGAAAVLAVGVVALYVSARRAGRSLEIELTVKTPHWVQMCAQGTLLLFWGWHVRAVYAYLPLILAQLLFAYALDGLLQWSRRDRYHIGFGPVPIILSINFFLWFRPEYYYWQFVIVALGYVAKEFVHWQRDGRSRHVFNPSSFPLSVFSLVLILTGTTDATLGLEIAQTLFNPPGIYIAIFLVALPAQMLFGVTTMTIASVVTAYAWSFLYFQVTGTYYFRDAFIPIAVFLGMHLLFTDPATSPRTEGGRVIFGVLYAALTIALAGLLEAVGAPTFYDKLLPIPILNLMVRRIDRTAEAIAAASHGLPSVGLSLAPARYRLAVVALWALTFAGMGTAGGLGDEHPGQYLPFWADTCAATDDPRACAYVTVMQENYCDRGSGWACNELGIHLAERASDAGAARAEFERACALGFRPGCDNVLRSATLQATFATAPPPLAELPIVLRGSKGAVTERDPETLYALGCERGWSEMCHGSPGNAPKGASQ